MLGLMLLVALAALAVYEVWCWPAVAAWPSARHRGRPVVGGGESTAGDWIRAFLITRYRSGGEEPHAA